MSSRRGLSTRANVHPPNAMRRKGTQKTGGRAVAAENNELPVKSLWTSKPRPSEPVHGCVLDGLFEKRDSKREEALTSILEGLNKNLNQTLLEQKFATFLYRCLNSVKKGSSKEVNNSFHVIGLLATIVGSEDKLCEIYRELLPVLAGALKSGPTAIKILDCLAIVAFFGAVNSDETETGMLIIWKYLNPESGSNVNTRNISAEVLVLLYMLGCFFFQAGRDFNLVAPTGKG